MSFNDLYAAKNAPLKTAPATAAEPANAPEPAPVEKAPSGAPVAPKA